ESRIVERIVFDRFPPTRTHDPKLVLAAQPLGEVIVESARLGFKMIESGKGRIDDRITSRAHLQAIVDIVESDFQVRFIEPTELLEQRFSSREACAGDCGNTALQHRASAVATLPRPLTDGFVNRAP